MNQEDDRWLVQQSLMLSLISYVGGELTGESIAAELLGSLSQLMSRSPTLDGQWEIVWGPAVYVLEGRKTAANMMYGVQSTKDRSLFAVVIRGTNSAAPYDVLEDVQVKTLFPWTWGAPPPPLAPQISFGVASGLHILVGINAGAGVPGAGTSLVQFLSGVVASQAKPQIVVTGQSLGGALAPTLALWLENNKASWDPAGGAVVSTISYAGFSAGNKDFATWSDQCIGPRTQRVQNSLDMVPYTWSEAQIPEIPGLYGPDMPGKPLAEVMVALELAVVRGLGYTQPRLDQKPLQGSLYATADRWFSQAAYQHVYGYLNVLGLQGETSLIEWVLGPGQAEVARREARFVASLEAAQRVT
jgi:hypothetical protein